MASGKPLERGTIARRALAPRDIAERRRETVQEEQLRIHAARETQVELLAQPFVIRPEDCSRSELFVLISEAVIAGNHGVLARECDGLRTRQRPIAVDDEA